MLSLPFGHAQSQPAASAAIRELHFSPDGHYVFAQDDTEITVLTAQPLAVLFRIPAHEVRDAQFTPDSRQIVFISSVSHVERWSIADRTRIALQDVPVTACGTERLSPDARFLVCVDPEGTLRLLDVATGAAVLERMKYGKASIDYWSTDDTGGGGRAVVLMDPSQARVDFSPDGRFFLAAPALPFGVINGGDDLVIDWDLQTAKAMHRRGDLMLLRVGSSLDYYAGRALQYFAFVTLDRLMISYMFWAKAGVVTARFVAFPSGKEIGRPKLPTGPLFRAADPAYIIVRPFGPPPRSQGHVESGHMVYRPPDPQAVPVGQRAAAAEIATGQVIITETPALDVFHDHYVAEPHPGEVGLYERGKGLQATIALHQK